MAQITISGNVTCKEGTPALTRKTLGESYTVVEFSVRDTEYFYFKGDKKDKPGQFYRIQVGGKAAEFLELDRGDFVSVTGQLVQRVYDGKTYLDVKDARVNQPYRPEASSSGGTDLF